MCERPLEVYNNWVLHTTEVFLARFLLCLQSCPNYATPNMQTYTAVENCVNESAERYSQTLKEV